MQGMKTILAFLLLTVSAFAQGRTVPLPLGTDPAPPGAVITGCVFYERAPGLPDAEIGRTTANVLTTGPRVTIQASPGTHVYVARFYNTTVLPAPSSPLVVESADSNVFTVLVPAIPAAPVNLRKP